MNIKVFLTLGLFIFFSSINLKAQLKTKSISVFKNGQSFVVKEGNVQVKNEVYSITDLPPALFGTLWFSSKNDEIKQVVSQQVKIKNKTVKPTQNLVETLYANLGKQATIVVDNQSYAGTIEQVQFNKESKALNTISTNHLLTFKTEQGKWLSIDANRVNSILFDTKPVNELENETDSLAAKIDVHFRGSGKTGLEMIYLQKGITWTPTYLLELISDSEAKLKMQAEVLNNLEDLNGIDMNFVVGVPNFKYANQPATLVNLPKKLLPRTESFRQQEFNLGQTFANSITYDNSSFDKSITPRSFGFNMEGLEVQNNLYFYKIKNVQLQKGGSANFPIFNTKVNIKHLYETVLPPTDLNNYRYQKAGYSFDEKTSEVVHSIKFKNSNEYPFTTAPVLIINKKTRTPLAQSQINYTPSRQDGYIKVTEAPDIIVKEKENLVNVDNENVHNFNSSKYKQITLKNEITVTNSKSKDIYFVLRKTVEGNVIDANLAYDRNVSIVANHVNQKEHICFEITVKAGEQKKITYTYNAWVRK